MIKKAARRGGGGGGGGAAGGVISRVLMRVMCRLHSEKQTLLQRRGYTTHLRAERLRRRREAMSVKHDTSVSVSAQAACFDTNL